MERWRRRRRSAQSCELGTRKRRAESNSAWRSAAPRGLDGVVGVLPRRNFASASTVIFQNIVFTVNYTRIIKETFAARLGMLGTPTLDDNFGRKERTHPVEERGGSEKAVGELRERGRKVVSSVYRAKCSIATLMGTCASLCVP